MNNLKQPRLIFLAFTYKLISIGSRVHVEKAQDMNQLM